MPGKAPRFTGSSAMSPDEFRRHAVELIDSALGHGWLIRGDNRKFLSALRTYVPQMSDEEIRKLLAAMPD